MDRETIKTRGFLKSLKGGRKRGHPPNWGVFAEKGAHKGGRTPRGHSIRKPARQAAIPLSGLNPRTFGAWRAGSNFIEKKDNAEKPTRGRGRALLMNNTNVSNPSQLQPHHHGRGRIGYMYLNREGEGDYYGTTTISPPYSHYYPGGPEGKPRLTIKGREGTRRKI